MFQRLAYSFEWDDSAGTQEEFKDSSQIWLNAKRPLCEMQLVSWKVFQRVTVIGGGEFPPPAPPVVFSRLDLGGGSAGDETMDAYPLVGWVQGTPEDGATPFTVTQLFGEFVAWNREPGSFVVTLASNPGCAGCLQVPCEDLATLRLLMRKSSRGSQTIIRTNIVFWLREYCSPCCS